MQRHIVQWDVTVMVHPPPHHHRWGIIIIIIIIIVSTGSSWYHHPSIRSNGWVGRCHYGRIIRGDVWCCGDCGDGLMIAVLMRMIHYIVVVVMGTIDMMQRWCVRCGGIGIGSSSGNGNHIIINMMIILIHVHNFIPIQWYSR